jgi:hypothetical protein
MRLVDKESFLDDAGMSKCQWLSCRVRSFSRSHETEPHGICRDSRPNSEMFLHDDEHELGAR